MKIPEKIWITLIVMVHALVPGRKHDDDSARTERPLQVDTISGYRSVKPEDISLCLANLDSALNLNLQLSLFFPGCLAPAAPLLLFRLKRRGFSACRILVQPGGVFLNARR